MAVLSWHDTRVVFPIISPYEKDFRLCHPERQALRRRIRAQLGDPLQAMDLRARTMTQV